MEATLGTKRESFWRGVTMKSVISGAVMAVVMCAANSFLTLKAGVIEEGPIISALIFTGIFFGLRRKVTATEAVIVATMGSAGGSFGFIANLFAAYKMVGITLTTSQMILFSLSTGAFSILMAIPFYYLFVVREPLPWVVGGACANVIDVTVQTKDTKQGKIILFFTVLFFGILLLQGKQWMPPATDFFTIGAVGIGLAWSPFFIGAGGLLGVKNGIGFLVGAACLTLIAPYTGSPEAPHRFFWPGVAFLIASGLTTLFMKWRTIVSALKSLKHVGKVEGDEAIISGKTFLVLCAVVGIAILVIMWQSFSVALHLGLLYLILGAFFLNLIATRAAGETTFNPARAMGVVMQGVGALAGGVNKLVNLTGAGMIAGGTSQTSILCQDLFTGRQLKVRPKLQVVLQASVLPVIALVSVGIFSFLNNTMNISLDNDALPAPVAKAWAGFANLLEGGGLPDHTFQLMLIFGIAGVVLSVFEGIARIKRYMPIATTGIGIGLILPIPYSLDFFVGAVLFLVLARKAKMSEATVNSIAAAGILGEAAGGLLNGVLVSAGIFPA